MAILHWNDVEERQLNDIIPGQDRQNRQRDGVPDHG